jgi:hypothetical protein
MNNPMKKCAHELSREFSKEDIQMANKHMKKSSPPLVIIEVQIKTTLRFHLTPVKMAVFKSNKNNKLWQQPRCPTTDEWTKKTWYTHIYIYTYEMNTYIQNGVLFNHKEE